MNYQTTKAKVAHIFLVNNADFQTINEILDYAEEKAANSLWNGEGLSPNQKYRSLRSSACKLLADYADQ